MQAVGTLREALISAQIRDVLRLGRGAKAEEEQENRTQKILMAYSMFSQHHLNFGEEEKYLMSTFGLNPLMNVNFWSVILDNDQNVSPKILSDVDVGVYNIIYVMPKVKDILFRETDKNSVFVKLQGGVEQDVKRLRVLIGQTGQSLMKVHALSEVIHAIENIYENLANFLRVDHIALSVGSIDSGSAKCLDFFGTPEVITEYSELINSVWQRLKYASQDELSYQVEIALMSVGFTTRISEAQKNGRISEQDRGRITNAISKDIEVLFQNGAYTEDMDELEAVRASDILPNQSNTIQMASRGESRKIEQKPVTLDPIPVARVESITSNENAGIENAGIEIGEFHGENKKSANLS